MVLKAWPDRELSQPSHASSHSVWSYHPDFQSTSQISSAFPCTRSPPPPSLGISSSFYFACLHDNSGIPDLEKAYTATKQWCFRRFHYVWVWPDWDKLAICWQLTPHFLFQMLSSARCFLLLLSFFLSLNLGEEHLSDHREQTDPIQLLKANKQPKAKAAGSVWGAECPVQAEGTQGWPSGQRSRAVPSW